MDAGDGREVVIAEAPAVVLDLQLRQVGSTRAMKPTPRMVCSSVGWPDISTLRRR